MLKGCYMLRDFGQGHNSPTATDKIIVFKTVTFDANGEAVVDFTSMGLKSTAVIHWIPFSHSGVYGQTTVGSAGTSTLAINKSQVFTDLTAHAAGGNVPAVVVPAVSTTLLVMFILDPDDIDQI